jgi:hypothetical protein
MATFLFFNFFNATKMLPRLVSIKIENHYWTSEILIHSHIRLTSAGTV